MSKNNNYFEVIVGTFVLACAIYFLAYSVKGSQMKTHDSYELIAKFDSIDGIGVGSDVKISGVKIGTVTGQFLDKESYRAALKIAINADVQLPADSSAKIASEGLLGSKFLSIEIGADDEMLTSGEEIEFTQSSVNLEDLLGKFIFNSTKDKDDD